MSLPLNIDQYEFIPKHLHDNFNNFEKFIIFLRKSHFTLFKNFLERVMILLSLIKTKLFIKNKLFSNYYFFSNPQSAATNPSMDSVGVQ